MAFERIIKHWAQDQTTLLATLSEGSVKTSRVTSCWFEWLRHGGMGAGQITLRDSFEDRGDFEVGQWVTCEYESGQRWYLGRIEDIDNSSPSGTTLSLYGPWGLLSEVFPGGFGGPDDQKPVRFAKTDYFTLDPDWILQSQITASQPEDVIAQIYYNYVQPATGVGVQVIEYSFPQVGLESVLFRGEEAAAGIIRSLAMLCHNASFGVDQNNRFFVYAKRSNLLATFKEGENLTRLKRKVDRSLIYNRLLMTGDYIYTNNNVGDAGFYRYVAHFTQHSSIATHGERRIRVFLPWIRRNADAQLFASEFFRDYANPTQRFEFATLPQSLPLYPWRGQISIQDRDGDTLTTQHFDKVKVNFDHAPTYEIQVGPEDPPFPKPPENQRWEVSAPQNKAQTLPPPPLPNLPTDTGTFTFTDEFTHVPSTPSTDPTFTDPPSDSDQPSESSNPPSSSPPESSNPLSSSAGSSDNSSGESSSGGSSGNESSSGGDSSSGTGSDTSQSSGLSSATGTESGSETLSSSLLSSTGGSSSGSLIEACGCDLPQTLFVYRRSDDVLIATLTYYGAEVNPDPASFSWRDNENNQSASFSFFCDEITAEGDLGWVLVGQSGSDDVLAGGGCSEFGDFNISGVDYYVSTS